MKIIEIFGKSKCNVCGGEFTDADLRDNNNNTGILCGCGAYKSITTYWDFDKDFTFSKNWNAATVSEKEIDEMFNENSDFDFDELGIDGSELPEDYIIIMYNHFLPEQQEFTIEELYIIMNGKIEKK